MFEIPALLSCERGNPEYGKIQNCIYIIFNFPTLHFLCSWEDKRAGEFKKYFCRSLPNFYTYPATYIVKDFVHLKSRIHIICSTLY